MDRQNHAITGISASVFRLRLIIIISRSAGYGCSGLSKVTTGTPEPSSLTSPEHVFS